MQQTHKDSEVDGNMSPGSDGVWQILGHFVYVDPKGNAINPE